MSRKLSIPFAIMLMTALFLATPQLGALQSVAEPEPATGAKAAQLNARLKDLDLERQALEQDQSIHKANIDRLRKEIQTMQQKHFQKGISSESFDEIVRTLQTQRVQLIIDLAGLEARQQAVQDFSAAKNANPLYLEVINKMQEQVDILKKASNLAEKQYKEGRESMGEYRETQRSLLAAEIQLRQMQLSNADSPEQSGDELRRIALERAEKSARLGKSWELLQGLETIPVEFNSLKQLKNEESMANFNVHSLEDRIQIVQKEYDKTIQLLDELKQKQADDN